MSLKLKKKLKSTGITPFLPNPSRVGALAVLLLDRNADASPNATRFVLEVMLWSPAYHRI